MRCLLFILFSFGLYGNVNAQTRITIYANQANNDTVLKAIKVLQGQLGSNSAATFEIKDERLFSGSGILLSAQPASWPRFADGLKGKSVEAVSVKSSKKGITIVGNSQLAVQHGVFIYLDALGFRYYFPNPDWYILPSVTSFFPKIERLDDPSFVHRRIWYSYGTGSPKAEADYNFWFQANRLGTSVYANFGHAYDDIVYRNWEVFKKHKEWFFPPLANTATMPADPKFNLADESLLQFVIEDAVKRIEAKRKAGDQSYKMVSMMPSDGLGTCNTPACLRLGSTITDRVFYFSDRVAKALRQKYPDVWIGGMSYGEYAEPPTNKLEPNTYVNIATAFNSSKYSTEDLIRLWSQKAGRTGIYDYLSLYNWDWDMPGQSQASHYTRYINTLKKYYNLGVRGFEAETNVGINKGIGHYLISNLLWDMKDDWKKREAEFFSLCFGNVADDVKKIWKDWESYSFKYVRDKDLADWIDALNDVVKKTQDVRIQKRLFQMKAYLYYLVLYNQFSKSKTEENRIKLLSYGYKMTDLAIFAGYPSLWDLGNGTGLPGFSYNDPNAKYKLNKQPVTEQDIESALAGYRRLVKKQDRFREFPLTSQFKLAPVAEIWKPEASGKSDENNSLWMGADYLIRIARQGKDNYIDFAGGFAKTSDKPIRITISKYSPDMQADKEVVLTYDYKQMEVNERIVLDKLVPGYYVVNVVDYSKIFKPHFSISIAYSLIITPGQQLKGYANHLYIYVPEDVSKFSVTKYEAKLVTPTGRVVDLANKIVEEAIVDVKPGEHGMWKLIFFSGELYFEGLPPVMGPVANRMLIPDNVK